MKKVGSLILCMGMLSSWLSSATSFEYIPESTRQELAAEFLAASAPNPSIFNKNWICDMYGMRSHMQVKKNVSLYNISENKDNLGSHPIKKYVATAIEFVGKSQDFTDRLRFTKDGHIIAELTSNKDSASLIAYSRCR